MTFSGRTLKRPNNGRPWNKSDIQKLIKLYPHTHVYQLARMFGRTEDSIRGLSRIHGLKKEYTDEFKRFSPGYTPRWPDEDIRILKKMYPTHAREEIVDVIYRTRNAIAAKARQLKLKKVRLWTKKEDNYLRRFYMSQTSQEISRILDRVPLAVRSKAFELGLDRKIHRWTKKEINLLKKHFPIMARGELVKLIGRSADTIQTRACMFGLRKDPEIIFVGGRAWTKEDLKEINRLYKDHTAVQLSNIFGITFNAVKVLLGHLNPNKIKLWTEQEDRVIRKYYRKMTYKELAAKLRRTEPSVEARVRTLRLVKKQPVWSRRETQILKREFRKGTARSKIANLLGKGKGACNRKIWALGLKRS